ncbi:MAG: DedA family protein [Phycisphaerae bacterium]|nr:DedA family protein [Phycisphaerae bacterium]
MSYEHWPYLGVFLILLCTGMGLPMPEDVPLLTAGYLCHAGYARVPIMIAVALVGVLGSDLVLFTIGRRFGHHVLEHRFVRRLVHPSRLLLAEQLFARHGNKIIFAGRFMPGPRPMIFVASGVLKVPLYTFFVADGLAAAISVPAFIMLGWFFGENLAEIQGGVRSATHTIVVVVSLAALLAGGIYWHIRRRRSVVKAGLDPRIDRQTLAQLPPGGKAPPQPQKPQPED